MPNYPWGLVESSIIPYSIDDLVLYTTVSSPDTWLTSVPDFDASTGTFNGFSEKANAIKVVIPNNVNASKVTNIGR